MSFIITKILFLLLVAKICCAFTPCFDRSVLSLITTFVRENGVSSVVIGTCCTISENLFIVKYFTKRSIMVVVHEVGVDEDTSQILRAEYNHLVIVLDLQCEGSLNFLGEAYEHKQLEPLYHWLLLNNANNSKVISQPEDVLNELLEPLELPIDSQVSIAHYSTEADYILIQEVYRVGKHQPFTLTQLQKWVPGQKLSPRPKRDNYGGIAINTATVVVGEAWENFFDLRYKNMNSPGKCNFMLMILISKMLNFKMNLTITEKWGFPKEGTKCYDGLIGMLQCGDVDIGALGLLYRLSRMDKIDYAGETFVYGLSFKFLKPSLSEVTNIYTLPFSNSVWIIYIVSVAIMTMALYTTQRIQRSLNPKNADHPVAFADVVLSSVGIMCAEGSPNSPQNVSSRMVFLFLLLLALFLTTSYSAIIVSLLQTPSNAINTLTDLIDGPIKLSMKDIAYTTKLINDTSDPEIKRMFHKKLYTRPYHEAFTTDEIGVESLRRGLNAFYSGSEAYKIMSDTFEEHEKCKLKEIIINPSNVLAFPIKKGSQYREHITQKARRLKETGMVDREVKIWFTQRPKCGTNSQGFVSVRIKDFYPTLVVLSIGMLCSIALLLLELLYHKKKYGKYWPQNEAISISTTRKELGLRCQDTQVHQLA